MGNWIAAASLGRALAGNAANVAINVAAPGTLFGDRITQLDFRVAKILKFGRTRTQVGVDLYNALNSSAGQNSYGTVTRGNATQAAFDLARSTVSYFGRVQEIVAPRVLKIGFKFEF